MIGLVLAVNARDLSVSAPILDEESVLEKSGGDLQGTVACRKAYYYNFEIVCF